MSSIKGSSLRIGGLNSGLDTQAIVDAMSASTKLRITTNQRKVLKLEAQQEAYRSIIGKFNSFRDKYFDILNGQTNLRSRSTFNRHQAKVTQNGAEKNIPGVNVSANANATAGNFNILIEQNATQAKITSASIDSLSPALDLSAFDDFTFGNTYAMSVTVGGTQRWVTFEGDSDPNEVIRNLNRALQVFGRTNNTGTVTGGVEDVRGRVFFNTDPVLGNIGFMSTDRAAISTGVVAELTNTVNLGSVANWETGNNSITLVIDGQTRTVNFQTVKEDYFNDLSFIQNDDGTWQTVGGTQESRNAFNAIIQEMYDKQRNDAFDAWMDSANRNENHNRVALTRAQRVAALATVGIGGFGGLTDQQIDDRIAEIISNDNTNTTQRNAARNALTNALNAESLSIRVAGLTAAGFDLTGVDTTNATAVNAFISANEGARAAADNATFNHIFNNQMTTQQRQIFEEEVARRNAQTRQTEFNRAVSALYNQFDTWQRQVIGGSRINNPDFNPMLPPSEANSPTINNPAYMFFEQWRDMMGLSDIDVEDLYDTHGDDWAEHIWDSTNVINENAIPFLNALQSGTGPFADLFADLEPLERSELYQGWVDLKAKAQERFDTAGENAYNGKIYDEHRLSFLQGGYNERAAFFNSFADSDGVIPGISHNDFVQQNVVGIPGTAAEFTAAQKRAALVAANIPGASALPAAGVITNADIDAFLASSAMNTSDASRLNEALLAQRTANLDTTVGVFTGAENLGRGLTTYERIAILNAQGINTSGIADATNHNDITNFINSSALTTQQRTAVQNAMVTARNNKIQSTAVTEGQRTAILDDNDIVKSSTALSDAQKIAALNAAGISHTLTNASTTTEINDFITALTGDDTAKWQTAELNARMSNVTATTERQKANSAISAAQVAHFNSLPKTPNPTMTPEALARYFNDNSIENILNNITFADGTKVEARVVGGELILEAYREDADGNRLPAPVPMGVVANDGSGNTFGGPQQNTNVSSITQGTRLSELALKDANDNPITNFTFSINDVDFSFGANTTIREMMTAVNNNARANVEMTFSTLTNTFEIKAKEFGADAELKFNEGNLLGALGFGYDGTTPLYTREAGKNMVMFVDSERVETANNSYIFNGIEVTVERNAVIPPGGLEFQISVGRDTSGLFDTIKSFVDDYNALIDYVFGYVSEPPDREFYFLTDADREELNLSDRQEQRWEERARKGLLYNDRTIISLMSTMRTAMFSGVDRGLGDGSMFGLFSMGITTSDNWKQNGKLVINEQRLRAAIENDIDAVTRLFTDPENGIMPKLMDTINSAVRSTGERWERGLLVQRAGVAGGTSATSNALYDQIKRLNNVISNLEVRYQRQQDRYWKIFSALETQMGQLNSQHDFISQMAMSNMWGNNR